MRKGKVILIISSLIAAATIVIVLFVLFFNSKPTATTISPPLGNNPDYLPPKPSPQPQPQEFTPTDLKQNILASQLNMGSFTPEVAFESINQQFIIDHKDAFFNGELSGLDAAEDIIYFGKNISFTDGERKIVLSFQLAQGSWYNKDGLGYQSKQFLPFSISGFSNANEVLPRKYKPTQAVSSISAIDLKIHNLTVQDFINKLKEKNYVSNYIFENRYTFLTGYTEGVTASNHIFPDVVLTPNLDNNSLTLKYQLLPNTWYNENGPVNEYKWFSSTIYGFRDPSVEPYPPEVIEQTKLKKEISATELKIVNLTLEEAINKINNQFIIDNKSLLFTGTVKKLDSPDDIFNLFTKKISDTSFQVYFVMRPGTYYNYKKDLEKEVYTSCRITIKMD